MTLRWYYSVAAGTALEITDRVRLPVDPEGVAIAVGAQAAEGAGWAGDLEVDDPLGDLVLLMFRRIQLTQDAAPAGAQNVGNWFITNLRVKRMDPWNGTSRTWVVQMADENSLLDRAIFVGTDANRPAETDIEEIRWFLTTTEGSFFSPDETYIDTSGPVALDATDLRQQGPNDMFQRCLAASGKHYWVKYSEAAAVGGAIVSSSVANPTVITTTSAHGLTSGMTVVIAGHSGSTPTINGTRVVTVTGANTFTIPVNVTVGGTGGTTTTEGRYVIWYANMNTSTLYSSTASLSNVAAEIDTTSPVLTWPLHIDAELDRQGGRMAYQLVAPYKTGWVVVADATFLSTYGHVDRVAPAPNVSSVAKATAQVTRQLAELQVPDDEISTIWRVEAADLNLIMHGMRVPVHASHFPNYTSEATAPGYSASFIWCRVVERTVRQVGPTTFDVPLRLSPTTPTEAVYGILYRNESTGNNPGPQLNQIYWDSSGDLPDSGFPPSPTIGPIHILDGPHVGAMEWAGFGIDGTGTVDLMFGPETTIAGVPLNGDEVTIYLALNGTAIPGASFTIGPCVASPAWPGGINYGGITVTGLAVVPGDEITAWLTVPGAHGNFGVPQGSAVQYQNFTISGNLTP